MEIAPLANRPETVDALAKLIVSVVADGASVSFMHPLPIEEASRFWAASLVEAEARRRVLLGAWLDERLVGTVTLLLDLPPNQPHRAEIAKLITALDVRNRGIARALMAEAERIARAEGRSLLTLDTASERGAAGFYEKMGFTACGRIPDFALTPYGALCDTILYFKRI